MFGAGGAARAIAVEAAFAGAASITVMNRDPKRGAGLVALLNEKTRARSELVVWDRTYRVPDVTNIVVNATSVGLFPNVESARSRCREPSSKYGGCRRHSESAAHSVDPRCGSAGMRRSGRARYAGQSGRDQYQALDRDRCRSNCDATQTRGLFGPLERGARRLGLSDFVHSARARQIADKVLRRLLFKCIVSINGESFRLKDRRRVGVLGAPGKIAKR